ncbi:MAG: LysR family transcriptional regulator [Pseudomonadota bacterium]
MDTSVNTRRIRYLYETAVAGSLRAAADKMDMNPSVVSRQIAKLEEELQVVVLERHGRKVMLTEAGHMLVEHYRQQSAAQDDLAAKLHELRGLGRGHIDLVVGEGFLSDLMGKPLQDFWRQYPGLSISIQLAGTNEVIRRIAQDEAHIGLVYNPPTAPGVRSRAGVRQPMCAITPLGHPLARLKRPLQFKQLAEYPVALMQAAFGARQLVQLAEHMERARLAPKMVTDSISAITHFVRGGLGVSLLPAFAVSEEIAARELLAIPIDQAVLAGAEAHIVTRLGRQLPRASNQLLLHLPAAMQAFDAGKRVPRRVR